jgi:hypothetical protein
VLGEKLESEWPLRILGVVPVLMKRLKICVLVYDVRGRKRVVVGLRKETLRSEEKR